MFKFTLNNCPFCGSKPSPLEIDFISSEILDKPCPKKTNHFEANINCSNPDCAAAIVFKYEMGMLGGLRQDEIIKNFKEQTEKQVIMKWNRRTVLD